MCCKIYYCMRRASCEAKDELAAKGWITVLGTMNLWPKELVPMANIKTDSACLNTGTNNGLVWLWQTSWALGWCCNTVTNYFAFLYRRTGIQFVLWLKKQIYQLISNCLVNLKIPSSEVVWFVSVKILFRVFKKPYFISWCSAITKSNYFWQYTSNVVLD